MSARGPFATMRAILCDALIVSGATAAYWLVRAATGNFLAALLTGGVVLAGLLVWIHFFRVRGGAGEDGGNSR